MKNIYVEKIDKPKWIMHKIKIEQDDCKIYLNLNKEKNIKKIINKLIKSGVTNVVLSKELQEEENFKNAINISSSTVAC